MSKNILPDSSDKSQLKRFVKKHKLNISPEVIKFCEEGLTIMNNSRDIMHKRGHIERMLTDLSHHIHKDPIKNADMEVLFTAICWHDTWKAQNGNVGFVKAAYQQSIEGLLCSKYFKKSAKVKIPERVISEAAYVIRKHSAIQLLPTRTLEAKILQDLDRLDKWSSKRIKYVTEKYNKNTNIFVYLIFRLDMKLDNPQKLNIKIFKDEFKKRHEVAKY